MKKTILMRRVSEKETKGCHRYEVAGGDPGVTTIYLRKESLARDQSPPESIRVTIEEVPGGGPSF